MKKRLIPQGQSFNWTAENAERAKLLIKPYPSGHKASAIVPLLDLAQRQNDGWLSQEAVEYVCEQLEIPKMQGYEVATFYSMFNLHPVGKYFLQVCTTTPCQLRGALDVLDACNDFTGVPQGQISTDGLFSVCEVECLGACVAAPVVQVNDDYVENLTPDSMTAFLRDLKSQSGSSGNAVPSSSSFSAPTTESPAHAD